eukprot:1188093-Rhodomonas_salina.3
MSLAGAASSVLEVFAAKDGWTRRTIPRSAMRSENSPEEDDGDDDDDEGARRRRMLPGLRSPC